MSNDIPPVTPDSLLGISVKAVPAVKYAIGIGGIVAVIAIVAKFGISLNIAVFGAVIMLVLMTALLLFSKLAKEKSSSFHGPGIVLTWFSLLVLMAVVSVLFTSAFWGKPVDLRSFIGVKPPHSRGVSNGDTPEHSMGTIYVGGNHSNDKIIPETEADAFERRGDEMEIRSIRTEACLKSHDCAKPPDNDPLEDHFTAVSWWKKALEASTNPPMTSRLEDKMRRGVGITCPPEGAAPCFFDGTKFRTSIDPPLKKIAVSHP